VDPSLYEGPPLSGRRRPRAEGFTYTDYLADKAIHCAHQRPLPDNRSSCTFAPRHPLADITCQVWIEQVQCKIRPRLDSQLEITFDGRRNWVSPPMRCSPHLHSESRPGTTWILSYNQNRPGTRMEVVPRRFWRHTDHHVRRFIDGSRTVLAHAGLRLSRR